jgi:CBS domain-containing protein
MGTPRRLSRVSHPILRLEVLAKDGTRSARQRVFCRLQRASVPVEECAGCRHCDAIRATPTPSVDCTIPITSGWLAPDQRGNLTEVGTLLSGGATVLEQSASLRDALRLLHDDDRRSIAVVDGERRLLGIVHEMALVRLRPDKALLRESTDHELTCAMSTAMAIHEATPVRVALHLLARNHLREATVVSSDGKPIGLFRDVDGLQWVARAREGQFDAAFLDEPNRTRRS